jgi:putative MATE family efflux protein
MFAFIAFVMGLSSGASVLIGQAHGAGEHGKVKAIAGTTLSVALLFAAAIALFGSVFARDLVTALATPANILDEATSYARVTMIFMPLTFAVILVTAMMRGVGDTMTPLFALGFSIVAGLVVTPALIQGWFGLPQLGVTAAAVAFIVGFVLVLIFLFFYLRARNHPLAPDAVMLAHLKIDPKILWLVLKLGIPAALSMVVASIAAIVVIGIINRFGSDALAAYGAVNQVLSYVQFPAMSMAIASSIFAAQAIGARRMDEVEHVTRAGLTMNLIVTGTIIVIAYLFSEYLVKLFITDPAVVELTETLLHIVLWSVILFGWSAVLSAVMRASGDVWIPMALSLATIVFVEVPAALYLSTTSLGLTGIWVGYTLSFTTALILQSGYYRFFWRKKEIKALI